MNGSQSRRVWPRIIALVLVGSAVALLLIPLAQASVRSDGVTAAWHRAGAAGSYHFTAHITQTTTPLATVTNVGRTSEEKTTRVDGQTNLPARQTNLTLWPDDTDAAQPGSALEVKL